MKRGVELTDLKQMRDELRVQAHLFTNEMKSRWERLERDWKTIERNFKQTAPPLVKELKDGYERMAAQLKENHEPQ